MNRTKQNNHFIMLFQSIDRFFPCISFTRFHLERNYTYRVRQSVGHSELITSVEEGGAVLAGSERRQIKTPFLFHSFSFNIHQKDLAS